MAVQGVTEFVGHGVADRATKAFSGKNANIRFYRTRHLQLPATVMKSA
jgi:hypothetical protein